MADLLKFDVQQDRSVWAIFLTAIFFILGLYGVMYHEMWRDELEHFTRARDHDSLWYMISHFIFRYGHVYHSLLYSTVHLFDHSFLAYQVYHLLLSTAAVYILNRYAPFSFLLSFLLSFGYFMFYEYGIISRVYNCGLPLLFIALHQVSRKSKWSIWVPVSIFLLANNSLFSCFLAGGVSLYWLLRIKDSWTIDKENTELRKQQRNALIAFLLGWGLVTTQYVLFYLFESGIVSHLGKAPFFMTIRTIWNAYVPIPDITSNYFWNTNIVNYPPFYPKEFDASLLINTANVTAVILSAAFLAIFTLHFAKNYRVMLFYLVTTAVVLVFLQFSSLLFIRYQGPLFLVLISAFWLINASEWEEDIPSKHSSSLALKVSPAATGLFVLILTTQFFSALWCFARDIKVPFTASYATANFIYDYGFHRHTMAAFVDYHGQPISAHLENQIYFPQIDDFGTYPEWINEQRRTDIGLDQFLQKMPVLLNNHPQNVLLILGFPLRDGSNNLLNEGVIGQGIGIKWLAGFSESVVEDEQYYLYEVYRIAN